MLKKLFVTLAIIIFFASNTLAASWQPEIRIGILIDVPQVKLQMSKPCIMIDADTNEIIRSIDADEELTIKFSELEFNAVEIRGDKIPLQDLHATIDNVEYFGGVRINKSDNSLTVINIAPVEEYLRGVLSEEISPSFNIEALKAQAVAARSFTLKNRNRHKAEGYDLCNTNHCQKYSGVETFPTLDNAVTETRGVIAVYNDTVIDANFHTDSGGMTENVADVWGTHRPYLVAVKELNDKTQPWTVNVNAKDFAAKLDIGDLKSIKLSTLKIGKASSDRSTSGRVKFVKVSGKKSVTVSGTDLRSKFALPSTLFDIKLNGGNVIFEGYGRGHGVGMSQLGAQAFAEVGWSFDKILAHYYSGTTVKKLYQ